MIGPAISLSVISLDEDSCDSADRGVFSYIEQIMVWYGDIDKKKNVRVKEEDVFDGSTSENTAALTPMDNLQINNEESVYINAAEDLAS